LDNKAPDAFRTISEVADDLDLPQHVLRFWESRFHEIKPMKRGGGRRYYRPDDIDLLRGIRHLLYGEGYTIRGVQRILREQGAKFVQVVWQEGAPQPPHGVVEEDEEFVVEAETFEDRADDAEQGLRGRLSSLIGRDRSCDPWCCCGRALEHGGTRASHSATGSNRNRRRAVRTGRSTKAPCRSS
jgi:DNA-binding transcriptional MerR regulator